jgi:hypothetical protein
LLQTCTFGADPDGIIRLRCPQSAGASPPPR